MEELSEVKVMFLEMDLGDLRSVKKGAEDFLFFASQLSTSIYSTYCKVRRKTQLHFLINNAGVSCTVLLVHENLAECGKVMCTPFSLTLQGFESQFQTNYLSHFYLTSLLLPTLRSTADFSPVKTVSVVNV